MDSLKTIVIGNQTLKITNDSHSDSPRTWCNLSKMLFFGNQKHFGDSHTTEIGNVESREEFKTVILERLKRKLKLAYIMPVNMYKHSGVSLSTSDEYPYNCKWDSGTIGFITVSKEKIRNEYNIKRVTKKRIKQVEEIALSELSTLNSWLNNEVYHFEVTDNDTDDVIDSCGGFIGLDFETNGILDYVDDKFHAELKGGQIS